MRVQIAKVFYDSYGRRVSVQASDGQWLPEASAEIKYLVSIYTAFTTLTTGAVRHYFNMSLHVIARNTAVPLDEF